MTAALRRESAVRSPHNPLPDERGRDAVRARILQAALLLFGRDGFENTTVRMIARRCGLSDAALYYYFRSKRDILDALWDIPQSRHLRAVDPSHQLTLPRLLNLVDEMIVASGDMDALVRVMIRQALSNDRAAAAYRRRIMETWRRDVRGHFLTALSPDAAALNTDLLVALVFGSTFPAQVRSGRDYPDVARSEEFKAHVRTLILTALPFCRDHGER